MKTRADLKATAKEQMQGNVLKLFVCFLIIGLISGVLGAIPILGVVANIFVSPVLGFGATVVALGVTYGDGVNFERIFDGFKNYLTVFLTGILVGIFTFLWSLLLIIPGIIKSISYSQAMFILAEHPEMSAMEAIDESKRIMDGHKMDYFVLGLSFIPWCLLGTVTCGLAFIYVGPYMQITFTNFYHEVKGGQNTYEGTATEM